MKVAKKIAMPRIQPNHPTYGMHNVHTFTFDTQGVVGPFTEDQLQEMRTIADNPRRIYRLAAIFALVSQFTDAPMLCLLKALLFIYRMDHGLNQVREDTLWVHLLVIQIQEEEDSDDEDE